MEGGDSPFHVVGNWKLSGVDVVWFVIDSVVWIVIDSLVWIVSVPELVWTANGVVEAD